MARDLKIISEDSWFLGCDDVQAYPINYRYVLSHAIRHYRCSCFMFEKNYPVFFSNIFKKLSSIKESLDNNKNYSDPEFINILFLKDGWGFVVVDQTSSIYPLILYTNKREKTEANERCSAFTYSLEEVTLKLPLILQFFDENDGEWDKDYQERFHKFVKFSYGNNTSTLELNF